MSNNEVGSPLFSLSEVFCPAIRILAGGCWVESQILNLKSTTECLTLHENKDGREKQKLLSGFLTSLLEIPCSILDIQENSRGGAERAEAEIFHSMLGILACLSQ